MATTDELRATAERFVAAYDGMEAILGPVEETAFAQAKQRFDPDNLFSPGQGIFA